jgi:hypothetical protein
MSSTSVFVVYNVYSDLREHAEVYQICSTYDKAKEVCDNIKFNKTLVRSYIMMGNLDTEFENEEDGDNMVYTVNGETNDEENEETDDEEHKTDPMYLREQITSLHNQMAMLHEDFDRVRCFIDEARSATTIALFPAIVTASSHISRVWVLDR